MFLLNTLFMFLISFSIGVIVTVTIQYYFFMKYIKRGPTKDVPKEPANEKYSIPKTLLDSLKNTDLLSKSDTPVAINLVLQFLFHELRYSNGVRKWFHRKLSLELDELISKTTTGRLFDKLSLRDLHLGSQFPEIKNISVDKVEIDETEGQIDTLDLGLELTYSGNFQLSIDANLVLGKKAYLAVKVKHVSGLARLQFTRKPYTHWSLSFYNEPVIDLAVESQFQGRQMQSNITSMISNQIRKAIKRKHTLPNYKLRYKPFFARTDPGTTEIESNDNLSLLEGNLEITTLEITRLALETNVTKVYYTMCVHEIPWISVRQAQNEFDQFLLVTLDIEVVKTPKQQLGIVFRQENFDKSDKNNNVVIIETIVPKSPAANAKLCRGDAILSVEGKKIMNMNAVAKIIKNINGSFTIRIERKLQKSNLQNPMAINTEPATELEKKLSKTDLINKDNIILETDIKKNKNISKSIENLTKISFSKTNDTVQIPFTSFGLRKRKSIDKTSSDSSTGSTPTTSNSTTPLKKLDVVDTRTIQNYLSNEMPVKSVLPFNEMFHVVLNDSETYLNINVWGKTPNENKDVLLGYLNIPLISIVNECRDSKLGHYLKCYSLLPPDFLLPNSKTHILSTHSGFEPCLCYGDILLSFMWSTIDDKQSGTSLNIKRQLFKSSQSSLASPTSEKSDLPEDLLEPRLKKHDFIRTHFHRATQCDFCGKKIWLKDAVQCRDCAMCCHKKCINKCQANSSCGATTSLILNKSVECLTNLTQITNPSQCQPEFKMTEHFEDDEQHEKEHDTCTENSTENLDEYGNESSTNKKYNFESHRQSFSGLIASVTNQGMKRVNSVNNLAIPGSTNVSLGSKSLPPSPQHTPNRKQSLIAASSNPFEECPKLLEFCDVTDQDSVTTVIDQLLHSSQPEELMSIAKETGKTLYVDLPALERLDKIHSMLSKLKQALDNETTSHSELTKQCMSADSTAEKTRTAFLMGQADSRIQALSVLMLHFCSGLQHAQECSTEQKD